MGEVTSGSFERDHEVIIAGGGVAGCALALWLRRMAPQARVLLLERGHFPRHKVCGEFVSGEGAAELRALAKDWAEIEALLRPPPAIAEARLFLGKAELRAPISPPALSIARYALDAALWRACRAAGTECRERAAAVSVSGNDHFSVRLQDRSVTTAVFVDASGRWSNLSRARLRPEVAAAGSNGADDSVLPPRQGGETRRRDGGALKQAAEKWIGIKAHFREPNPAPSVDLYFFDDGYCGVQPLGEGRINACAMAPASAAGSMNEVLELHPALRSRSRDWERLTEDFATAPLLFPPSLPWDGKIFRVGDAAGFVDPFLGDGITLALKSGRLAAECLAEVCLGKSSLASAGEHYQTLYREQLAPIFKRGSGLRKLLRGPRVLRAGAAWALQFPPLAKLIV